MIETAGAGPATFDGLVCIGGEDWWYHNRGHFDFQIMRRLARHFPVLFVNSLGVRMPSPRRDKAFLARIGRKLKSLSRGLVHVEAQFHVFSPVTAPGAAVAPLSRWALAPQIRHAAARAGISRPLLWVHCPPGAALVAPLDPVRVILQRTDRFEAFPDGDPVVLGAQIAQLKSRCDLAVYAAPHLAHEEAHQVRRQLIVTHGVDVDTFVAAGLDARSQPSAMDAIARPRVGFIGGIDHHTFDPELFLTVAGSLPDVQFVMVGGCSLPAGWCPHANVHFMGRQPYEEIAHWMAAMDVLVMPWNRSDWIRACNPIKLKEYLAVGRPVVTTDFPALDGYRDLVRVAEGPMQFAAGIRAALAEPLAARQAMAERQRDRVAAETWDAKADLLRAEFARMGLTYVPTAQRRVA